MSGIASRIASLPGRSRVDVPVLLAQWRTRELWTARQFRACGGASLADVEDIYDETIATLVERDDTYESEEHLRAALHRGIKMRAMRLHRDRQLHSRTLEHAAPTIHTAGHEKAWYAEPERALIAREDDLIIGEFVAELTDLERRVFALIADGRSWRAIATALRLAEPDARKLTRACERKRTRFLTLYSTGRLCGYRSQTITALRSGTEHGELALAQALAHPRHCRKCQTQHHTDADTLRAMFDARVLGVLPAPILAATHTSLLDQLHAALSRISRVSHRPAGPPSGVRERAFEVLAGSGASAKLAAGVISVVLVAAGAVGATHSLTHHHPARNGVRRGLAHGVLVPTPRLRHIPARPHHVPKASHTLPRPNQQHTPAGSPTSGSPPARDRGSQQPRLSSDSAAVDRSGRSLRQRHVRPDHYSSISSTALGHRRH
jgi:DNA-directed RNA polymerase specialized sigma24 family protein